MTWLFKDGGKAYFNNIDLILDLYPICVGFTFKSKRESPSFDILA